MSLVEVMVAMTIGLVIIAAATQMYIGSRSAYSSNETVARLQENARFALTVIEPDVRASNYWGYLKGAGFIDTSGVGSVATNCGATFATNLSANLQGDNNGYSLACAAYGSGAMPSSDTLTVRRAAVATTAVAAAATTTLRICSTRDSGQLVTAATACLGPPQGAVNDMIVNTYYVDRDSETPLQAGLPSLRRWTLSSGVTPLAFQDTAIIAGVEDMQIQFGIDPTGITGIATQYVDAVSPAALGTGQVVSVRIWLLMRAETAEVGYIDSRTYEYGDRAKGNGTTNSLTAAGAGTKAYAPADGFRRLLVTRTIMIRNAMGT